MTSKNRTRGSLLALASMVALTGTSARAETSERTRVAPYVEVTDGGLAAHLYVPEGDGPFPVVVAVGGSEGGFITGDAYGQLLPKEGLAVLGLAYFGAPGLPKAIDRIPLEYFIKAIDYAARHPKLDASRIGLVGGSKGGELALLLGAHDARIRAVCAIVPSGVVWQSARLANSPTSSWTYRDIQFPFVPYKGALMPASQRLVDLFELSLQQESALAAATIPVENINGSILLISATNDEIWPSKKLADRVVERLAELEFAHPVKHLSYETGHGFSKELAPEVNGRIIEFFSSELRSNKGAGVGGTASQ